MLMDRKGRSYFVMARDGARTHEQPWSDLIDRLWMRSVPLGHWSDLKIIPQNEIYKTQLYIVRLCIVELCVVPTLFLIHNLKKT